MATLEVCKVMSYFLFQLVKTYDLDNDMEWTLCNPEAGDENLREQSLHLLVAAGLIELKQDALVLTELGRDCILDSVLYACAMTFSAI